MNSVCPRVLVIGGSGFIGYHLILRCKKLGWHVVSISKNKPKKNRKVKNVNYLVFDISEKKNFIKIRKKNFDFVINLGGYINHKDKINTSKGHFLGVKNLVNFFKKKKIKSFVQIGSSAEYGLIKSPHVEDKVGNPKSIYGKSKLQATKFLLNCNKEFGFPVTILRFYQVYGPKQKNDRFIPLLINSCIKNIELATSQGKQKRDFLYVNDAVKAITQVLKNKKCIGQVLNVGSGKPITLLKIMKYVKKKIGRGKFLIGKIKLRSDEPNIVYPSLKKTVKYLKWKKLICFTIGINNTIKDYRKEFKLLNHKKN